MEVAQLQWSPTKRSMDSSRVEGVRGTLVKTRRVSGDLFWWLFRAGWNSDCQMRVQSTIWNLKAVKFTIKSLISTPLTGESRPAFLYATINYVIQLSAS